MLLDIFSFLTMPSNDKPIWVDFIAMLIPIVLAALGYIVAFRAWERQKKREIDLNLDQKRYESELEACKGIWPLLAFMSAWENDKTVVIKRGDKYYFRKEQGKEYLKQLPEVFFDKGCGVFMPSEVRSSLYHFRGIVYKLLEAVSTSNPTDTEVEVLNPEIPGTITDLFNKINGNLRKMLRDSNIEFDD